MLISPFLLHILSKAEEYCNDGDRGIIDTSFVSLKWRGSMEVLVELRQETAPVRHVTVSDYLMGHSTTAALAESMLSLLRELCFRTDIIVDRFRGSGLVLALCV